MAKHMLSLPDFKSRLRYYQIAKIPYRLELQGNSRTLTVGGISFYCYHARVDPKKNREQMLPAGEISFISKVKKHIVDRGLDKSVKQNYRDRDKIKFIDYNKRLAIGEYYDDCYCVDINGAYWVSALHMGYIDQSLFKDGLTKDKRVRLACLGTFAKSIDVIEFDGITETFKDRVLPLHPEVFFNCANIIYKCMDACKKAAGNDFLFYWTDCVYVKNKEALKICQRVIKEHGFECKEDFITRITFADNHIEVAGKESKGVRVTKKYGVCFKD